MHAQSTGTQNDVQSDLRPVLYDLREATMFPTLISKSNTMTLEEVIIQLMKHEEVDGIVILGSASKDTFTPASDYDLFLSLSHMPAPLSVALTWIDHRLTDLMFLSTTFLDQFLSEETFILSTDSYEGSILNRLSTAPIAFDRHGQLKRVQQLLRTTRRITTPPEGDIYSTWFSLNYNLLQTKRMLTSDDPIYSMAIDFRLLYTLADLWTAYFRIRHMPWSGEKESIRYFQQHDPDYLIFFERCLHEQDLTKKVQMYEDLVRLTLAPLGKQWQREVTAFSFTPGTIIKPETLDRAHTFWQHLVTE
jgi:hypothetical protein